MTPTLSNVPDGTTTTTDAVVTVFTAGVSGMVFTRLRMATISPSRFEISFDGGGAGSTWLRIDKPANESVYLSGMYFRAGDTLHLRRIAGGSNVTVFFSLY